MNLRSIGLRTARGPDNGETIYIPALLGQEHCPYGSYQAILDHGSWDGETWASLPTCNASPSSCHYCFECPFLGVVEVLAPPSNILSIHLSSNFTILTWCFVQQLSSLSLQQTVHRGRSPPQRLSNSPNVRHKQSIIIHHHLRELFH